MFKKGCFKVEILKYILVAIVAIVISPFLKGLVNKFVEEDEIEERESAKKETSKKEKNKKEEKKTLSCHIMQELSEEMTWSL